MTTLIRIGNDIIELEDLSGPDEVMVLAKGFLDDQIVKKHNKEKN